MKGLLHFLLRAQTPHFHSRWGIVFSVREENLREFRDWCHSYLLRTLPQLTCDGRKIESSNFHKWTTSRPLWEDMLLNFIIINSFIVPIRWSKKYLDDWIFPGGKIMKEKFLLLTCQRYQYRSLTGSHREIRVHPYAKWPQSKKISHFLVFTQCTGKWPYILSVTSVPMEIQWRLYTNVKTDSKINLNIWTPKTPLCGGEKSLGQILFINQKGGTINLWMYML